MQRTSTDISGRSHDDGRGAAGASPRRRVRLSRRGTILLLVVGVLALMSIVALVYATLGRSERASTQTATRAEAQVDVSGDIADYVTRVIAEGALARYPELTVDNLALPADYDRADSRRAEYRRRAYDLPGVDERAVSVVTTDALQDEVPWGTHRFTASGSFEPLRDAPAGAPAFFPYWAPNPSDGPSGANFQRPREYPSPFLASAEPTFIATPQDVTTNRRTDTLVSPGGGRTVPDGPFRLKRDWAAISNLAPSGNFVNLANLRNNFDAESGFGEEVATRRSRLSDRLTLWDAEGRQPASVPTGQSPDRPLSDVFRWDGQPARYNRPADWSTNQLHAFRPMVDVEFEPGDPRYLFNQWADADGDGFSDSRWFELTRLTYSTDPADRDRPYIAEPVIRALAQAGVGEKIRFFAAVRVVDNASMVNVNTARDFFSTPTSDVPAGATPADIDLRRLLTMQDYGVVWSRYQQMRRLLEEGAPYAFIPQGPLNTAEDYQAYRLDVTGADAAERTVGYALGIASYAALREATLTGRTAQDRDLRYFSEGDDQGPQGDQLSSRRPLTAAQRAEQFDRFARTDGPLTSATALGAARDGARGLGVPFGLADELELRTFNGVNDPQATSRLESVLGARWRQNLGGQRSELLSVLRDNRSLATEKRGRDVPQLPADAPVNDADPVPADRALLAYAVDVRRLLTTVSGARPIVEGPDVNARGQAVAPRVKVDAVAALNAVRDGVYGVDVARDALAAGGNLNADQQEQRDRHTRARYEAVRQIFAGYMNALNPFSDQRAAWDLAETPARGLSYGGSAEVAMRTAARMALNLVDAFDKDRPLPSVGDDTLATDALGPAWSNRATAPQWPNNDINGAPFSRAAEKMAVDEDPTPTAMTLLVTRNAVDERLGTDPLRVGAGPGNVDDFVQDPRGLFLEPDEDDRDEYPWPALFMPSGDPLVADFERHGRTDPNPGRVVTDPAANQTQNVRAVELQDRKDPTDPDSRVDRVNLFGVEPQPFLVDTAFYSIACDAPEGTGGDKDGTAIAQRPADQAFITLNRSRDLSNADFICDILAFTLHNPFDQRVYLYRASGMLTDAAKPRYYLEFGNRFYLLARMQQNAYAIDTTRDVFLEPGESKVYYAINPATRDDLLARVRGVLGPTGASFGDVQLLAFLRRQLGDNIEETPIVMVNPRTWDVPTIVRSSYTPRTPKVQQSPFDPTLEGSQLGTPGTPQQLFELNLAPIQQSGFTRNDVTIPGGPANPGNPITGAGPAVVEDLEETRLWRVMRTDGAPNGQAQAAIPPDNNPQKDVKRQAGAGPFEINEPRNDLLADRLRDPVSATTTGTITNLIREVATKVRFPADGGNSSASGLDSASVNISDWQGRGNRACGAGGTPIAGDGNFGVVMVSMAKFSRPLGYEIAGGFTATLPGVLPPWCLESKKDREAASGGARVWNTPRSASQASDVDWSLNWKFADLNDDASRARVITALRAGPSQWGLCAIFNTPVSAALFDEQAREPVAKRHESGNVPPGLTQQDVTLAEPGRIADLAVVGARSFADVAPVYVAPSLLNTENLTSPSGLPQAVLNSGLFSRAGDFLLPLAVGPEHVPNRQLVTNAATGASRPVVVGDVRSVRFEAEWLTLSEALALASDYYAPATGIYKDFARDTRRAATSGPAAAVPVVKRGQLVIDAWTPFLRTGQPTNPMAQPIGSGVPLALGVMDQFQAGLGVASQFAFTAGQSGAPVRGELGDAPTRGYGSLTESKPGVVNLNTAPRSVLNVLPLVSPEAWTDGGTPLRTQASSWLGANVAAMSATGPVLGACCLAWGGTTVVECVVRTQGQCTGAGRVWTAGEVCLPSPLPASARADGRLASVCAGTIPQNVATLPAPGLAVIADNVVDAPYPRRVLTGTAPGDVLVEPAQGRGLFDAWRESHRWDNAATLLAYRDKTIEPTRPARGNLDAFFDIEFDDDVRANASGRTEASRRGQIIGGANTGQVPNRMGVVAVREERGFKTLGEVALANTYAPTGFTAPQFIVPTNANSVQRYGRVLDTSVTPAAVANRVAPAVVSGVSFLKFDDTTLARTGAARPIAPEAADALHNRLALANALTGTASVRSDVFTAYVLVHGYSRSDVSDLEDASQPMIPSVVKRYVLVVDRSNVTTRLDTPRVLMFKEVPAE